MRVRSRIRSKEAIFPAASELTDDMSEYLVLRTGCSWCDLGARCSDSCNAPSRRGYHATPVSDKPTHYSIVYARPRRFRPPALTRTPTLPNMLSSVSCPVLPVCLVCTSFSPTLRFFSGDGAPRPDASPAPRPRGTPRSVSSRPSATAMARLLRRRGGAARGLARR